MKINEVENLLGLTRANIRFYEKEGLLTPARKENGYREYSETDLGTLKKIVIFRKLGLSLPEIKDILNDKLELSFAIEQNISNLNQQIAELKGALEVCNIIKKEHPQNEHFDENHYWELIQSKEKKGEKFAALAKDYLEMEKKSFLSMWSNAFLFDFHKELKKFGWKIIFPILLCICVIRGIAQEFFWPGESFLEGFTYPFVLFGMISIIILPIFLLHQKYKQVEPEEEQPLKYPRLIGVFKWIAGLAYFVAYLFFIPNIALLSIIGLFLSLIPSCTWYDCFTEDVLIVRRLFYKKSYTWNEIDYYTLSASSNGTLTYSVIMQDGTKADCIGGEAILWMSNLPEDKYPEYEYDFVKYLSRKFKSQGVELKVEDWGKLYKDLRYESWIDLAEEINDIAY